MKRFVLTLVGAVALFASLSIAGPQAATIKTAFGPFLVVQSAAAADEVTGAVVDVATARGAALREIASLRPDLVGMSVASASYAAEVLEATAASGAIHFDQNSPRNLWLAEVTGPPQAGYAHVVGLVVIDANTGQVVASGVGTYN